MKRAKSNFIFSALFLAAMFIPIRIVQATITPIRYWRMGENDALGALGANCTNTIDIMAGAIVTNTIPGGASPFYTENISSIATAEAGSLLGITYANGQYGKGDPIAGVTDNFGIEAWVNPANVSGGKVVVYNGNTGASGWGFYQSNDTFAGLLGGVSFFGSGPAQSGVWTHLALVRSSGVTTLYVNGIASGTTASAPFSAAGNLLIGANNSAGELFAGSVDEIRVFTFAPGQFSINDLLLLGSAYSLGLTNLTEGPAGGSDSVLLASGPSTAGWPASANATWLHLNISAGIGSTNVTFSFDANDGATRVGTITIAGLTLTVTQAGSTYIPAGLLTTVPLVINANSFGTSSGLTVDSAGNVYVPDSFSGVVRKWQPGNNTDFPISFGPNIQPLCLAVAPSGNIYFADFNANAIGKWVPSSSNTFILGAIPAGLLSLEQIAVDAVGNVFVPDSFNNVIYKLEGINGRLSTVVSNGLSGPSSVAVDAAGNLYIADTSAHRIAKWTFATGTLSTLVGGLNQPGSVTVDGGGNVYFADSGFGLVQKWTAANGQTTTLAGGLTSPDGVAVDSQGSLYTAENLAAPVKKLPRAFLDATPRLEPGTAGGDSIPFVYPVNMSLAYPFTPAVNSGGDVRWLTNKVVGPGAISLTFGQNNSGAYRTNDLYVFFQPIHVVQAPTYALGSSLLTEGTSTGVDSVVLGSAFTNYNAWSATTTDSWLHPNFNGGSSTNFIFRFDANSGPTRVGGISLAGMNLTVVQAGSTYVPVGTATRLPIVVSPLSLGQSAGVSVDGAGTVYVSDPGNGAIKVWNPGSLQATNLVLSPSGGVWQPLSVTADPAGNLYILDGANGAIERWSPATGVFCILTNPPAGVPGAVQIAVDSLGNLYYPDGIGSVYKWTASSNTFAPIVTGLGLPTGAAVDAAGNVYIADFYNNKIVKWIAASGASYTLLGGLSAPAAVALDGSGNVYVAGNGNSVITKYTIVNAQTNNLPITTLAPNGVAVDTQGNVYTSEANTSAIQKLPRAFVDPTPLVETAAAGVDALPPVLPVAMSLGYPFTPAVDPSGATLWLTNTGVSSGVVNLAFGRNDSGVFRTNTVYVLFQAIPVSQFPAFSLGVSALTEGPAAGSDSVVLAASIPNNAWTATSADPWLQVVTTAGIGSTNIVFSFDTNVGPTRVGTITVAGQALAVTQAGSSYVSAGVLTPLPIVVSPNSVGASVGLSVDPQGNVYVPDYFASAVKLWHPGDMNPSTIALGTTGQPPLPVYPTLATADAAGNIYLLDGGNNALEKWSPATGLTTILAFTPNGVTPMEQLALDSAGNLYLLDPFFGGVYEWSARDGSFNPVFVGVPNATGMAVDLAGYIYIADAPNNRILKFAPNSGGFGVLLSGVANLGSIAVDGSGNLYYVDTGANSIKKWSAATSQISTPAPGLNSPNAVAVDVQGNIYTCESTTLPVRKLPRAFVDPTTHVEGPNAGVDALAPVLPTDISLTYPFTPGIDPSGDTLWLQNSGITDGIINLTYAQNNSGAFRTNSVFIFFQRIVVAQSGAFPTLLSSQAFGHNQILLSFTNLPAATFSIRASTNLTLPLADWAIVGSATNVGSNFFQFAAPITRTNGQQFFGATSP